jgi:hypothetical protein
VNIYLSVALFSFNGIENVYMKKKLQSSCSDGKNKRNARDWKVMRNGGSRTLTVCVSGTK